MRTRNRFWAAAAALAAGPFAAAQGPAALPNLPAVTTLPQPPAAAKPDAKPEVTPPKADAVTPPAAAVPTTPVLGPPPDSPTPCVGCGDAPAVGPTDPVKRKLLADTHTGGPTAVWLRYEQGLLLFKPHSLNSPIAVGGGTGQPLATLLGEDTFGTRAQNSFKISGGMWLNDRHTVGVGLAGFMTEHRSRYEVAGTGTADGLTIRRPFVDALTGQPASLAVAEPGFATGAVAVALTSRLSGADAAFWRNLAYTEHVSIDLFFGFRYLDLDESMTVYQTTTPLGGVTVGGRPVAAGTPVMLTDRFYTRNQFYGGDLGGKFEYRHNILFFNLTPRVAFGPTHQVSYIDGKTEAGGTTYPGGLLAVGTPGDGNVGRSVTSRFALVTELGSQVGLQITSKARVSIGYNFLYMNNVVRPGGQYGTTINPRLVPSSSVYGTVSGTRAPQRTFDREDFYAHGATVAFELQY